YNVSKNELIMINYIILIQTKNVIRDATLNVVQTCALPIYPVSRLWIRDGVRLGSLVPLRHSSHTSCLRHPRGVENYSGEFYISSGVLPSGVHLTLLGENPRSLREARLQGHLAPHEAPAERLVILAEIPRP